MSYLLIEFNWVFFYTECAPNITEKNAILFLTFWKIKKQISHIYGHLKTNIMRNSNIKHTQVHMCAHSFQRFCLSFYYRHTYSCPLGICNPMTYNFSSKFLSVIMIHMWRPSSPVLVSQYEMSYKFILNLRDGNCW